MVEMLHMGLKSRSDAWSKVTTFDVHDKSICTTWVIVLLVLMENCLYLIDTDKINIVGVFNYNLIWLFALVSFILYWMFRFLSVHFRGKTPGRWAIAFLVSAAFIAAYQSNLLVGQPFARGIVPQRSWLAVLLSFFALYKLFDADLVDRRLLFNFIMVAGGVATCLYAAQALLGSSISIIHVHINERYGSSRVYVDSMLCVMAGLLAFREFLKTTRLVYIPNILLLFVYELVVSKGRLELAAVIVALGVAFLTTKRNVGVKSLILPVALLVVVVFAASNYGQLVFQNYLGAGTDVNYLIRLKGRDLYVQRLSSSWTTAMFGCGYPDSLYPPAAFYSGISNDIFLVDNGIFAFTYVYGLFGLAAVGCLWARMLIDSLRLCLDGGDVIYLMYVIASVVMCQNIIFWWWQGGWMLLFPLMYCSLETEISKLETRKDIRSGR